MNATSQKLAVLIFSLLTSTALAGDVDKGKSKDDRSGRRAPHLSSYQDIPATSAAFPYTPPEAPHRHSSTAAEGWLRGQAVLRQADANYLLESSQANILSEHAESLDYDNYLKRGETAFARKQMVDEYRDYKRQRTLDRRRAGEQFREQREQELAQTYRLSQFEVNLESGAVYWPTLVAGPRYAAYRRNVELVLHQVIRYGRVDSPFLRDQLRTACDAFRHQLRKEFQNDEQHKLLLVKQQYSEMDRFLLGLQYVPMNLDDSLDPIYLTRN